MKKRIKRIHTLVIASVFIISAIGTIAVAQTTEPESVQPHTTEPLDPAAPTPKGNIWFGIVSIQTTDVQGSLPEENYMGILNDVTLTLQGSTQVLAVPIPFMFLATSFETTDTVSLQMEFFWGAIHTDPQSTSIDGFARAVTWEW